MQLSRTLGGCCNIIHGKEFPTNSIVLICNNGTQLVCTNFHQSRKQKLKLYVWLQAEKKWVMTYAKNEYTEMMWNHYRKCEHKNKIRKGNYNNLMRHDRKHKSGGRGGTRIFNGSITDYECAKNPLHDFRRVYN